VITDLPLSDEMTSELSSKGVRLYIAGK